MSRFVMNEGAWRRLEQDLAAGLNVMGAAIVATAGESSGSRRVARSGGVGTYLDGQRVAGDGDAPRNVRPGRGVVTYAGFGSPISHLIEFGTAPHVIERSRASVLASGGEVYGTIVHHPGTRPRPFLTPSVLSHSGRVGEYLRLRR